eukprot:2881153-Amphidinium_carterae.3
MVDHTDPTVARMADQVPAGLQQRQRTREKRRKNKGLPLPQSSEKGNKGKRTGKEEKKTRPITVLPTTVRTDDANDTIVVSKYNNTQLARTVGTRSLGQTTQMTSINKTLVLDDHYKSSSTVRQCAVLIDTGINNTCSSTTSLQPDTTTEATTRRSTDAYIREWRVPTNLWHTTRDNFLPTWPYQLHLIIASGLKIHGNTARYTATLQWILSNDKVQVRLHYIGNHFYIKAAMVNSWYKKVYYTRSMALAARTTPTYQSMELHLAQRKGADQAGNY